jgi:hypothetical protein
MDKALNASFHRPNYSQFGAGDVKFNFMEVFLGLK